MLKYLRQLKVERTTRNELGRLTDRELADLGITRGDIDTIARQTTVGRD